MLIYVYEKLMLNMRGEQNVTTIDPGRQRNGQIHQTVSDDCRKIGTVSDEKTLLIVPEQKTMQAQKNIVMHHPRHGVMNVDVLSFERLAYRIFEELGLNQKEILEDTGKSMIIRRILTEHEEELSAFRGNIRKKGFVDEVKSMLSELLQYGVTPDILRKRSMEMGTESVLYAKLQDITVIYEAFLDRIHEKYMTTEEVPDRLCDVIEQSR